MALPEEPQHQPAVGGRRAGRGGLCCQSTSPFGTMEEAARPCSRPLRREKGGFLFPYTLPVCFPAPRTQLYHTLSRSVQGPGATGTCPHTSLVTRPLNPKAGGGGGRSHLSEPLLSADAAVGTVCMLTGFSRSPCEGRHACLHCRHRHPFHRGRSGKSLGRLVLPPPHCPGHDGGCPPLWPRHQLPGCSWLHIPPIPPSYRSGFGKKWGTSSCLHGKVQQSRTFGAYAGTTGNTSAVN